jgi:hypothetical protein
MNAPARLAPPRARPKGGPPLSIDRIPENARASDQDAQAFKKADRQVLLAERIETEIERIREARPHLSSRLDRASTLLLLQLASSPRQRPVKVRIAADGRRRFLVSSTSSGGVVYSVDCATYACNCPDAQRRGIGCKHGLCCFILRRVAREARAKPGCQVCVDGWVYMGEDVIDSETGEVTTFHNPTRCRRCAGVGPPYLTDEELQEWMASVRWIYAKSMPKHPHEYCLKREQDGKLFERVVRTIWDHGYDRSYLRRPWRSLDVGDYFIWIHTVPEPRMPVPVEDTVLVNRALRVQERLV